MAKMTRCIAYGLLCLSVALPQGASASARAASLRSASPLPPAAPRAPTRDAPPSALALADANDDATAANATDATAAANGTDATAAPTPPPTPAVAPAAPTPPPTPYPTRKYEPLPDDEEEEEKKKGPNIWKVFLWIVVGSSVTWALCYFRIAIFFFCGNLVSNIRRFGCKGCLASLFPCLYPQLDQAGSEPMLDQIIFESEDPNVSFVH